MKFKLVSPFQPAGDQPQAIRQLVSGLKSGAKHQVLLGVTGSGKTFTMAEVIEKIQRPTLVISHNKTLAAQLYQEFKEFFPTNEVHYFVSYYDYYQPEAYLPQTDTYIEKDAKINEEIDRLRHATTQALLERNDTIVVASVSCIYNIGSPKDYQDLSIKIKQGQKIKRDDLLKVLASLQYERKDTDFKRGSFRIRGEIIEIWPAAGEKIIRLETANDKIEKISLIQGFYPVNPRKALVLKPGMKGFDDKIKNAASFRIGTNGVYLAGQKTDIGIIRIFPAKYWVAPEKRTKIAIANIKKELKEQLERLQKQKKLLEAERLGRRTNFDLEMLQELGYCHGVENYSRHLEFRQAGQPPFTLLDYYRKGFLTIIDESHMTIPQIGSMFEGDQARKKTLIKHGFRLPSALDNRPLKFNEFEKKTGQVVYVSATPAKYELSKIPSLQPATPKLKRGEKAQGKLRSEQTSSTSPVQQQVVYGASSGQAGLVEQVVRPTGLLDPLIEIRSTKNQVPDLIKEIKKRASKGQRALVTTLTKRLAEDLAEYLRDQGVKAYHLHSEIKTLERPEILRNLRLGKYDVVVGINLLREGLDLPEVSLVAILDADKEGFLRSETTLVQTMGRAARHKKGYVIMYADHLTGSMRRAIKETERRRKIQQEYNKKHKIIPQSISKKIKESSLPTVKKQEQKLLTSQEYLKQYIKDLQFKAELANRNLQFDQAVETKKEIERLKRLAKRKRID